MKLFDEIKIKEKDIEAVNALIEKTDEARGLIDYGAEMLKRSKDRLFESIENLYPELDDYKYSVNHKNHIIKIVGLKEK